jgi:hypothetical protein
VCRNGVCVNSNVINSQAPQNECDAERGVITFFVGNTALGRYDFLCRSIDPGIAPNNPNEDNNMCKFGNIDINYLRQFPSIANCSCPIGTQPVILPATSQVRSYVHCIEDRRAAQILNN